MTQNCPSLRNLKKWNGMDDLGGHTIFNGFMRHMHSLVVKIQRKFIDLAQATHKLEVSMVLNVIDCHPKSCICHLSLTLCRIEGGLKD